jgi:hypothetical protein
VATILIGSIPDVKTKKQCPECHGFLWKIHIQGDEYEYMCENCENEYMPDEVK